MVDQPVKLLGTSVSLFCTRIEWALKLKGVEYEYLEEDVENKSPLLLKYNPIHKKVPVLVHNEKPVAESLNILEYIDGAWKDSPLLPKDPYERAMARFWAKFADEKGVASVYGACLAKGDDEKEKAIKSAIETFAFLEKQLEGKKYFGGEQIGYLDLALGWIPPGLDCMEEVACMKVIDAQRLPLLHQWAQNFMESTPMIKECLPPRDKLLEHTTDVINYMRSSAASQR